MKTRIKKPRQMSALGRVSLLLKRCGPWHPGYGLTYCNLSTTLRLMRKLVRLGHADDGPSGDVFRHVEQNEGYW